MSGVEEMGPAGELRAGIADALGVLGPGGATTLAVALVVLTVACWPGPVRAGPTGSRRRPGEPGWPEGSGKPGRSGRPPPSGTTHGTRSATVRSGGNRARRRGRADDATVDDLADTLVLLALVLRGGTGHLEAVETVARVSPPAIATDLGQVAAAIRWGVPVDRAWDGLPAAWRPAGRAWALAAGTGAAPAAALEDAASRLRSGEERRVQAAVARAGTLLVLPLGTCFLPAFAASTVVPVVLALLGGVVA